ncbi:hypothetical protein [Arthrobacter sp. Y81]|uniref:hypothetical protein n=1 Tax=Arthrobacter sp. Y81 TaxID=2058897 RepID=UPI0015E2B035|nr:hypothetical protein [Arthrobacter sp. Y81]
MAKQIDEVATANGKRVLQLIGSRCGKAWRREATPRTAALRGVSAAVLGPVQD